MARYTDCKHSSNPFVNISFRERWALVGAVFLFKTSPSILYILHFPPENLSTQLGLIILLVLTDLLIAAPLLFSRLFGTPTGFLHPMVFPTLLIGVTSFVSSPIAGLGPFAIFYLNEPYPISHIFDRFSQAQLWRLELELQAVTLISLIGLYVGFAIKHGNRAISWVPRAIPSTFYVFVIVTTVLLFAYFKIQQNGGIFQHFASLAFGRFNMREGLGFTLILLSALPYLLLLVYLKRPAVMFSVYFIPFLALLGLTIFVATGSRSEVFSTIMMALAAWAYVNRRIPMVLLLSALALAVPVAGLAQELRSGQFLNSTTDASGFSVEKAITQTVEEGVQRKSLRQNLSILAFVPEEIGHRWGETYLGVVGFFIPRTIWSDKPRAGGADVAALIYYGRDSTKGYRGEGYPISGAAEAFWNFSYPGVFCAFVLFGMLKKYAALQLIHNQRCPNTIVLYIAFIFVLIDFNSDTLVTFFQLLILISLAIHLGSILGKLRRFEW